MKKEDTDKGKGKFAMRIIGMTAILAILCLFSVQSVSAVQVSENVEFHTSGTNTTFIMGKDFNFDEIEVRPTDLMLGDATISVSPSDGSIDFTLFNLSTEYWKWNESCSNPGATTDHTMGGLNPNTPYLVKVGGATYEQCTSNGSGYVSFTYSGGYSDKVFEMEKNGGPPLDVPALAPPGFLLALVSLLGLAAIVMRKMDKR